MDPTADGHATELASSLGVRFADPALLELALSHRSWAFEAGGAPTNERLEFLGDAVLGLVVTDRIYRICPDASEGKLAKLRAATVSTVTLATVARGLGIGDAVKLGRGEEQSGGRDKDSILADTLEAVLGAVYLDGGMDAVADLVGRLFDGMIEELRTSPAAFDSKTALQELAAAQLRSLPVYEIAEEGPDHEKRFTATALLDGRVFGRGQGRSKKEAEQAAARAALEAFAARTATGG